jgi:2'-5' RNA ligase
MTSESALVVLVPEAAPLVEEFRKQHDPAAQLDLPAHVTILYPFKRPGAVTADVLATLSELFSSFPGFEISFKTTASFPEALCLLPEPDEPFRRLTKLVAARFPENQPYEGRFADIRPHLTVAQTEDPAQLSQIASEFATGAGRALPLRSFVDSVVLLDNEDGYWQIRHRFALGGSFNS